MKLLFNSFFMALVPSFVCVENLVLETKKDKSLVSTTFTATFYDGSQKMLNLKKWTLNSLLKSSDFDGKYYFSKNENTLFFRDWSRNPVFGCFNKNYPSALIPDEITELM